ncbi:MAG: hypothetical protein Q4D17_06625 [Planctomycetia bacterium]|nr:hypothetical protein [Planctomycetia bacterium]
MQIILTLEQFPVYLPGAYGNKTQKTPGLDALTLESTVFDRAYSSRADGLETLFQFWEAFDFSAERFSGGKIFLSDLPVEAPDFFDAGETVVSKDFFASPEFLEEKFSLSETGLVWIHFQDWELDALDSWLRNDLVRSHVLAVMGTSGELPKDDLRLYSSEVQLPWWIRFSVSGFAATRSTALVTASDFQKILEANSPEAKYRESIQIIAENDRWAFVTDEWFLTGFETGSSEAEIDVGVGEEEDSYPELYFKPFDWWEQNNVASRCFDEVQKLLELRNQSHE